MNSAVSNAPTSNGRHEAYRALADIIRIYWEYHKLRVFKDGVLFAPIPKYVFHREKNPDTNEFDLVLLIEKEQPSPKVDIREEFSSAIRWSLERSWFEFFGYKGYQSPPSYDCHTKSDFLNSRIDETDYIDLKNFDPINTILSGIELGADTVARLIALSYKYSNVNHRSAIQLSRVGLGNSPDAFRGVRLENNYPLVDPNSKTGINEQELRKLGYGMAIGCPASLPQTRECRNFLEKECGVTLNAKTMLEDLYHVAEGILYQSICRLKRSLTQEDIKSYISEKSLVEFGNLFDK